jgi:hypothetical protein
VRCAECRCESLDVRWSPLCPVCYELLRQEQRREQTRPPHFEAASWTDDVALDAGFDAAIGPKLP